MHHGLCLKWGMTSGLNVNQTGFQTLKVIGFRQSILTEELDMPVYYLIMEGRRKT